MWVPRCAAAGLSDTAALRGRNIRGSIKIRPANSGLGNPACIGVSETLTIERVSRTLSIMSRILFYRVSEAYGEFSNFSPHPFELKGKTWPTSEHYFQAQKFAGTEHEESLRVAKSPMIVARMGRNRKLPLRTDWETAKDDVMRDALRAKFTQHPSLRSLLLSTRNAELVEHTANDHYWADGGDGTGVNRLGQLLMELRASLK